MKEREIKMRQVEGHYYYIDLAMLRSYKTYRKLTYKQIAERTNIKLDKIEEIFLGERKNYDIVDMFIICEVLGIDMNNLIKKV